MEPGEALTAAAQIAVALAGFAGVVVAFRSNSLHDWSVLDKFRLLNLLGSSLIALFACLFGMLLLTIKPVPVSIWRWSSAFSLLVGFVSTFLNRRRLLELGPTPIGHTRRHYAFYLIVILGMATALLQIYNSLFSGVFWIFYIVVIYSLAVAALQFVRMIFQRPDIGRT